MCTFVCVCVYECEVFKLWLVLLNRFQTKAQQRRRKIRHINIMSERKERLAWRREYLFRVSFECCRFFVDRHNHHSSRHNFELWSFHHLNAINLVRAPFRFVFHIRRNVFVNDVAFKQIRNASTGFLFLVQFSFFLCSLIHLKWDCQSVCWNTSHSIALLFFPHICSFFFYFFFSLFCSCNEFCFLEMYFIGAWRKAKRCEMKRKTEKNRFSGTYRRLIE